MVNDLEHAGRALQMLEKLARLRKEVEGGMTEAEANVHANRLIMEGTMRDPTVEEREKLIFESNRSSQPEGAPCMFGPAL
eukprot:2298306-Pyramimonas_sp.AAC.1